MTLEGHTKPKSLVTSLAEVAPVATTDPMQRLPSELISRIFECYYGGDYSSAYADSPMVLGSVCHTWRDIAWSTPSLWDVATFDLNPYTTQPLHNIVERTKTFEEWIDRSGALPLTIHVYAYDQYDYELDDEDLMPLIKIINQCSSRWYKLELELPVTLWSALRPITSKSSEPSLTSLRSIWLAPLMVLEDDDRDPVGDLPQCFIPVLPNLESLQLNCVNFNPGSVEGAWNHLTKLLVGGWPLEACMEAIRKAPSLSTIHVTVRKVSNEGTRHNHFSHITLDALRNLTFVCRQDVDCDFFFDTLTAPSLQSLAVGDGQISAGSIINMLERSETQENVNSFSLTRLGWTTEQICTFLTKMTNLKSLALDHPYATIPSSPTEIFRTTFAHQNLLESFCYWDAWPSNEGWKFLEHLPTDERRNILRNLRVSLSTSSNTSEVRILERSTLNVVQEICRGGSVVDLNVGLRYQSRFDVLKASIEWFQEAEHL